MPFADDLFPGIGKGLYQFRIAEMLIWCSEETIWKDLAQAPRGELLSRRFGDGVRLEVADNRPEALVQFLPASTDSMKVNIIGCRTGQSDAIDGGAEPGGSSGSDVSGIHPGLPKELRHKEEFVRSHLQNDILLLHPFQSFTPVIDLLRQAAKDPQRY